MILLRFVAVYCIFDAMNIVFASAIKGAGDTRFVMLTMAVLAVVVMIGPTAAAVQRPTGGLWLAATTYIALLGIAFWWRFRQGRWQAMRVIETAPVVAGPQRVRRPAR